MTNILFIGDLHFHHEKIIKTGPGFDFPRPFPTVSDHNEALVSNYNKVVGPNDVCYILGDCILNSKDFSIFGRLNGRKKVILGNHDTAEKIKELNKYVECCLGSHAIHKLIITHIPVHPCELEERFIANIHAHRHSHSVKKIGSDTELDPRYINVSAEQINYTPIFYEAILEKVKLLQS